MGERSSRKIPGLMLWTFFHTEYGITSRSGVEQGEDLLTGRACLISLVVSESAEGFRDRWSLGGRGSLGGKK